MLAPVNCSRIGLIGFAGLASFPARHFGLIQRRSLRMSACRSTTSAAHENAVAKPNMPTRRRVLILAGPTAVGKSAVAMELASRLGGEIISADSVQVYKGLDVGSNKASPEEQATVPHHLLDVADLLSTYSAGNFFQAARQAVEDVASRNRIPIVVGGTMMYVRWFIYGRPATPPPAPDVVARVDAQISALNGDWNAGIALLAAQDAGRASALSQNDWYRLSRALQVAETTGGIGVSGMPLEGGAPSKTRDLRWKDLELDFRCIFLYTDRIPLNRRIDARCEHMILPVRSGMFDQRTRSFASERCDPRRSILVEVGHLLATRSLTACSQGGSPTRAIGYRQTIEYLLQRALSLMLDQCDANAAQASGNEDYDCVAQADSAVMAFRAYIEEFQQATRGYAKQQLKWFRKEPHFLWVRADDSAVSKIEEIYRDDENLFSARLENSAQEQEEIRSSMLLQGKQMKTYVSSREVITENSEAEWFAVDMSERMAKEISAALGRGEIADFLQSLARPDTSVGDQR
jgi:tRNA dimethylallyltransferase